jgi:plasmid stability protein
MLQSMGTMLQIKDVPEDVHRILKSRAALAGVSLTEYARQTLEAAARRRSREELVAAFSSIEPVETEETAAETLAEARREYE